MKCEGGANAIGPARTLSCTDRGAVSGAQNFNAQQAALRVYGQQTRSLLDWNSNVVRGPIGLFNHGTAKGLQLSKATRQKAMS